MSKDSSATHRQTEKVEEVGLLVNGSADRALETPAAKNKQCWKEPPLKVNKPEPKTQHPDSAKASPILLV